MENNSLKNPWLGLKAYQEGEIIYGRDQDTLSLSQYVINYRETVLYGRSGIGKSSILNAGVIPTVRGRGFVPVALRLEHDGAEQTYVEQTRRAIVDAGIEIRPFSDAAHEGPDETLWSLLHHNTFHIRTSGERVKILLIFDQFEEIFTLRSSDTVRRRFFGDLADVINDIVPDTAQTPAPEAAPEDEPSDGDGLDDFDFEFVIDEKDYVEDNEIHLVFTLREDFLSELEYHTSAIPALRQHRFGLRPINEEQAAEIIMRPRRGLVSKDVAKLIIEKVTGRTDFELDGIPEIEVDSAVLSLYLSQLYEQRTSEAITADLVEERGGAIIKEFYLSSIAGLAPEVVEYLEDELINADGRRENKSLAIVRRKIGPEALDLLLQRQLLRRFAYSGDLRVEFIHDILCPVIKERRAERVAERDRLTLLERQTREREALELKQRQARRRARRIYAILGSIIAVMLLGWAWWWYGHVREYSEFYADYELRRGWPVGVGPRLSDRQCAEMPLYYRLSRRGRFARRFTQVELCSSNPLPPAMSDLVTVSSAASDERSAQFADLLSRVRRIRYLASENDSIDKEVYLSAEDSVLFVRSYYHLPGTGSAWMNYLTPAGQAMPILDVGTDRIKVFWDEGSGRIASMVYFDSFGVSHPIDSEGTVYGYRVDYLDPADSYPGWRMTLLDNFSQPLAEGANTIVERRDGEGRKITSYGHVTATDTTFTPVAAGRGIEWSRRVDADSVRYYYADNGALMARQQVKRDRRGNVVLEKIVEGSLAGVAPETRYAYDDATGYVSRRELRGTDNMLWAAAPDGICLTLSAYRPDGTLRSRDSFDHTRRRLVHFLDTVTPAGVHVVETEDIPAGEPMLLARTETLDGRLVTAYFDGSRRPVCHPVYSKLPLGVDTLMVHRVERIVETLPDSTTVIDEYYYTLSPDSLTVPIRAAFVNDRAVAYHHKRVHSSDKGDLLSYQLFDADGSTVRSMMYFYSDGMRVARAVMGIENQPVRCPDWEEEAIAAYKLLYQLDFNNTFSAATGADEWGHLTPFVWNGSMLSGITDRKVEIAMKDGAAHQSTQYNPLPYTGATASPMAYLHVLSKESPLYVAGLRDNDRIIALGAWRYGMPVSLLRSEWQRLDSGATLRMNVLRPSPATAATPYTLKSFTVTGPGGVDAHCHILPLTTSEEEIVKPYL